MNRMLQVDVGDNEFVHVRIFKPLPCYGTDPQLDGYQLGKTLEDKLVYFDGQF